MKFHIGGVFWRPFLIISSPFVQDKTGPIVSESTTTKREVSSAKNLIYDFLN